MIEIIYFKFIKNPEIMWFISLGSLAITLVTWNMYQKNIKWKKIYEIFKYLTAGLLLLMFLNMY